ncbi:two-component response regulator ORR33-like [Miscanthus floridulus]|uniref:two-component response regulator ORR33-like n=1 Tax=Miscanthus floridulus TaxID=154761 RepID=UPI00345A1552
MVMMPKDKGGLGLIDPTLQNQALLLKQLDKFFNKKNVQWVNLIWNKYYSNGVPHFRREKGSFWWKDILRLHIKYRGVAICNPGIGDTIRFWDDLLLVVTCPSLPYALKGLSDDRFRDIDVVLVHAAKAAKCGFDFRGIVESDLRIPVVYSNLAPDHKAAGDEADQLLRTLQEATYIIKKPFDDGKELGSTLPKVIAWRKCVLESQAKRAAAAAVGAASALPGSSSTNDVDEEGEDEEEGHIHFKVVKSTTRNRKRKGGGGGSDPGASSSSSATAAADVAGGDPAPAVAKRQEHLNVTAARQEKDNMPSQQQAMSANASPDYPPVEPQQHHVLGMDSNVDELTMAGSGGASDSNAKPFMDLDAAAPPNGDQLLSPGAQDDDDGIFGSLMGSQGLAGVVVDGNACLMAGMFPCDHQFEDDTPFPLEALLEEIEADMGNDADQDDQLQGGASGAGSVGADVAGTTSLVGGEGGGMMSVW